MMNGNTTIVFRKYDEAVDRLKAIYLALETEQGRALVLDRLSISCTRWSGDDRTVEAVGRAMSDAMKADAPKYLAGLISKAQDDVRDAAEALRNALGLDLDSKFMKPPKGGK